MGIFDALRDAVRPDDDPQPENDDQAATGPKHREEGAAPEFIADPSELEQPTGGKHARRD